MANFINSHKIAITTKYLGPTNVHGSRVKASNEYGSVTIGYDCALNSFDNHALAANKLCEKYGLSELSMIGAANDTGYVFIELYPDVVEEIKA